MEESQINICNICANHFTDKERIRINCPKCQFECCSQCFKRQCMEGVDPMCMNIDCRAIFSEDFMYQFLSFNFMKGEYRKKRAEVILEREKSLMEATMPHVEKAILTEDLENKLNDLLLEKSNLKKRLSQIKKDIENQRNLIHQTSTATINTSDTLTYLKQGKQNYLKKCTVNNCRGYLNSQYKCELCKTTVCSKCFEPKNEGHVCNENDLKTAELLRKDTKSCPNCNELIYKISGCNQMYCTSCHTAFDWKTGKIVTGVVHNPHYFEYRRKNGNLDRQPGDIPCGGLPSIPDIIFKISQDNNIQVKSLENIYNLSLFRIDKILFGTNTNSNSNYYNNYNQQNSKILSQVNKESLEQLRVCLILIQFTTHIRHEMIPNYIITDNTFNINLKHRIKYLMNKIDENELKKQISIQYGKNNKKTDICNLYTTLATLLEEQFRIYINNEMNYTYEQFINESLQIIDYINNCFQNLTLKHKQSYPKILITKFGDHNSQKENYLKRKWDVSKINDLEITSINTSDYGNKYK